MTFEFPKLIWMWVDDPTYTHGGWNLDKESKNAPYVRGDLYNALVKERDELRQDMGIIDDSFIAARQNLCKALARAAAAAIDMRERAAEVAKNNDDEPDWLMSRVEGIRDLPIDPDAQKALDKLLAKAREDAIREAAELFTHIEAYPVKSRILALLNEGEQNE